MTPEEKLKDLILAKYKSLRAFTQECNISYSTVNSMLLRGIAGAGVSTVLKVCQSLDISVEDLLCENKKSFPVTVEEPTETEKRSERLYQILVESGWIPEGGDLTEEQFNLLKAAILILNAAFPDSDE